MLLSIGLPRPPVLIRTTGGMHVAVRIRFHETKRFRRIPVYLRLQTEVKEPASIKYIVRTRDRVNRILLIRGILFTLFAK